MRNVTRHEAIICIFFSGNIPGLTENPRHPHFPNKEEHHKQIRIQACPSTIMTSLL